MALDTKGKQYNNEHPKFNLFDKYFGNINYNNMTSQNMYNIWSQNKRKQEVSLILPFLENKEKLEVTFLHYLRLNKNKML